MSQSYFDGGTLASVERKQFIMFIEAGRPEMPTSPTEEEIRIVGEHFAYLKGRHESGDVILVGRTQEAPFVGIAIFEADDSVAAEQFAANDPGIRAGVFRLVRIQPYQVALMRT